MIVVTGAPRSATSYMVLTISKLLGVDIVGPKWIPEHGPKGFNPEGYWTLPASSLIGGVNHDKFKGKVVKILGFFLERTDPKFISHLIYCHRQPECAIPSLCRLCREVGEFSARECQEIAAKSYIRHTQGVGAFLEKWKGPYLKLEIGKTYTKEKNVEIQDELERFFKCHM